jgi:hypothetical protein
MMSIECHRDLQPTNKLESATRQDRKRCVFARQNSCKQPMSTNSDDVTTLEMKQFDILLMCETMPMRVVQFWRGECNRQVL